MHAGLGSSPFARRYLGNHSYFLFLQVLRCFSSLRLPLFRVIRVYPYRVPPFGNLRFLAYLPLPEAYRCSSRPSSAPSAKAFTVRPSLLNHNIFAYFLLYNFRYRLGQFLGSLYLFRNNGLSLLASESMINLVWCYSVFNDQVEFALKLTQN